MQTEASAIQVIGPAAGETVNVLGAPIVIKSEGRADQLFFADHPMAPGYAVPLHVHETEDELFYILEGELTLDTQAGEVTARAGSFVHLPRGVPHGFHNATAEPVRMIVVTTPGGALEGVFRGLDALGASGAVTPESIAEVCGAHRVNMLYAQAA